MRVSKILGETKSAVPGIGMAMDMVIVRRQAVHLRCGYCMHGRYNGLPIYVDFC
jgi:hypothetical protein